jgi:hypothetical protein
MIGILLYVIASRPYVMQSFGKVTIFQVEPKETHVLAMKRIFKYLKVTTYFGLWHPKLNELTIVTYMDAYWAGSIDDKRSASGVHFYIGDYFVS